MFIGRDDEDGNRAGQLAAAVGILTLGGYLRGGMTSWSQEQRPLRRTERVAVDDMPTRLRDEPDLQILDVRDPAEWDAGHLPGSVLQTWHDITAVPAGLDPEKPVAVICGSGQRSAIAASLIERHGARHVIHVVDGGVPKLRELGMTLESGTAAT